MTENRVWGLVGLGAFVVSAAAPPTLIEVVVDFPLSTTFYIIYFAVCSLILLPFVAGRSGRLKSVVYLSLAAVLLTLHVWPWSSRKTFLRDLWRVKSGMTVAEVELIMGKYIHGTGWRADVFSEDPSELRLGDSVVYRHSNDGRYNSDWGIVKLKGGHVVSVEFWAD